MSRLFRRNRRISSEILPEDIFLDSSNSFDRHQMEGRIEKAISQKNIAYLGIFFLVVGVLFFGKVFALQIKDGQMYAERSLKNSLRNTFIFADRGLITDRDGDLLAWNTPNENAQDYAIRKYTEAGGFDNLLGYVKYPAKDKSGFYYKYDVSGADGLESHFNTMLAGVNGLNIVETDALGNINSSSTVRLPEEGKKLVLSVDKDIQASLYKNIKQTVETVGFVAGSGIIMDVHTGEVLALTTFPSYSSQVMSDGQDKDAIAAYFQDSRNVFLDRPMVGLYAPGSIVKPFIALGALEEKVIDPYKQIESKGLITIPNPYFPDKPSIFRDWKKHGWTDMREAIAVSSDVYFYAIGGGYEDQKGIGISGIDKYITLFGFGAPVGDSFFSTKNNGTIPTPDWKKEVFNGDPWRLGDTYNSSIGQFGFQVTAVQAVRAVAALANGGTLIDPVIVKKGEEGYQAPQTQKIGGLEEQNVQIVKEGMRMAVTDGTLTLLDFPDIEIAAKSGTAEVGSSKQYINSWSTGYFPYDNPRYAYAIVLEKGPSEYLEGASAALQRFFYDVKDATSTTKYIK